MKIHKKLKKYMETKLPYEYIYKDELWTKYMEITNSGAFIIQQWLTNDYTNLNNVILYEDSEVIKLINFLNKWYTE